MEVRVIKASEPSKNNKINIPLAAAIGGVSGYALKHALPVTIEDLNEFTNHQYQKMIEEKTTKTRNKFLKGIEEEAKNALVARFDSILTDNGATVVESKDWEKRRLAYEIQDFREGLYHVVNVESDNDFALNEFDRLSKINGDILRHMIVKLDA